jgi:hypothetical protein
MTEAEYRKQRSEAESQLAGLPDHDKLMAFERHRDVAAAIPAAIAAADPERLQELVVMLVERVDTADQFVASVSWGPAARPFFRDPSADGGDEAAPVWRPRTDSNRRRAP